MQPWLYTPSRSPIDQPVAFGMKPRPLVEFFGVVAGDRLVHRYVPFGDPLLDPDAIPAFCFPRGPTTENFETVLTGANGTKLYAAVLGLSPGEEEDTTSPRTLPLPIGAPVERRRRTEQTALCVVSAYPLLTQHRAFLAQLVRISRSQRPSSLESFIANYCRETPVPPRGISRVLVTLGDVALWSTRPAPNEYPHCDDANLDALFGTLSLETIVVVWSILLAEDSVALVSESLATTGRVALGLLALLFPLEWRGALVPCCPRAFLRDFLDAPVPFLLGGLDHDFFNGISERRPAGVTFVDLDNDLVYRPRTGSIRGRSSILGGLRAASIFSSSSALTHPAFTGPESPRDFGGSPNSSKDPPSSLVFPPQEALATLPSKATKKLLKSLGEIQQDRHDAEQRLLASLSLASPTRTTHRVSFGGLSRKSSFTGSSRPSQVQSQDDEYETEDDMESPPGSSPPRRRIQMPIAAAENLRKWGVAASLDDPVSDWASVDGILMPCETSGIPSRLRRGTRTILEDDFAARCGALASKANKDRRDAFLRFLAAILLDYRQYINQKRRKSHGDDEPRGGKSRSFDVERFVANATRERDGGTRQWLVKLVSSQMFSAFVHDASKVPGGAPTKGTSDGLYNSFDSECLGSPTTSPNETPIIPTFDRPSPTTSPVKTARIHLDAVFTAGDPLRCEPAPTEDAIKFFEETCAAKKNRHTLQLHKQETPFLLSRRWRIIETYVVPPPKPQEKPGVQEGCPFLALRASNYPRRRAPQHLEGWWSDAPAREERVALAKILCGEDDCSSEAETRLVQRCTRVAAMARRGLVARRLSRWNAKATKIQAVARGRMIKDAVETVVHAAGDRLLDPIFDAWRANSEPLLQRSRVIAYTDDYHFRAPPCLGLALRLDELRRVLATEPEKRHAAAQGVADTVSAVVGLRSTKCRRHVMDAVLRYVDTAVVLPASTWSTPTNGHFLRRDSPVMARFAVSPRRFFSRSPASASRGPLSPPGRTRSNSATDILPKHESASTAAIYDGIRRLTQQQRDEFFRAFGISTTQKLRKRKLTKLVWQHRAQMIDSARLILLVCEAIAQDSPTLQTPADRCRDARIRRALLAAANVAMVAPGC